MCEYDVRIKERDKHKSCNEKYLTKENKFYYDL